MLWPIDYLSTANDVYVCNDGVHLVVAFLDWNSGASDGGNAIEFYSSGRLLDSYSEDDLVVAFWPRIFASNITSSEFPTGELDELDESAQSYEMQINWGDVVKFDITTGKIVESRMPWILNAFSIATVGLLLFFGTFIAWQHFSRRRAGSNCIEYIDGDHEMGH